MASNACDVNHLDSDSLLPPRKRLLAGFKKQNNGSPTPCFASSSSTSISNGSSSASNDVQTHLDNLLTSQLNHHLSRSPDHLVQTSKASAALAVKVAKAARATANQKAMIASKAVAAAKTALELFASFPVDAGSCKERSPRKNKQKKHVPVQLLYSKGAADDDLARRLNRAINNSPRVVRNVSAPHRHKKQKSLVPYEEENSAVTSTMYDGNDVAGVVDSDSSTDDDADRSRVNGKLLLCYKEKTGEESASLGKRRGRVKLKKLPLSMCASKDQENGITKSPLVEKNAVAVSNPLAQPEGSNGEVAQVRS